MMASLKKREFMSLSNLLEGIVSLSVDFDIEIRRLVMDSRIVEQGDLFFALPGLNTDGRTYIDDAVKRGAAAVVWQCEQGTVPIPVSWRPSSSGIKVPVIAVEDLTYKVGIFADRFYHSPSKSMFVVGITGTNGKTSCSHFIAQAIDPFAHCGVIGTLGWGFINKLKSSSHTTPDALTCHEWLHQLAGDDAKAVAMEVSSHALDQGRVSGVEFDCAVFTNLSHDHLDYHGSMQNYAEAKRKLFLPDHVRHLVINVDDSFGQKLVVHAQDKNLIRYGLNAENQPDILASHIVPDESGVSFTLSIGKNSDQVRSQVYGLFNIYNLLAAAGVMHSMGMSLQQIIQRLELVQGVDGRLEILRTIDKPVFVIDYAHTPDALEKAISAIRDHFKGNIWCVVGCGGDRDKQKRPKMGAIAEQYADTIIITNDNPRTESPVAIAQDMLSGMNNPDAAIIEYDRKRAIEYAFEGATSQDVILVAGKGHEDYQIIGNTKTSFSDKAVIISLLSGDAHV